MVDVNEGGDAIVKVKILSIIMMIYLSNLLTIGNYFSER